MIIVGGTYIEECNWPEQKLLMGPGSRAALALHGLARDYKLYTYCAPQYLDDLRFTMSSKGIATEIFSATDTISFFYPHSLTSPRRDPETLSQLVDVPALEISADTVLAFGLPEAKVHVNATKAVFEMSGGVDHLVRGDIGALALIAGENDLPKGFVLGNGDQDAAAELMTMWQANTLIVRRNCGGGVLFHGDYRHEIPTYAADEWFKIGAGNVFCATFAYYWGDLGFDMQRSADLASRSAAYYAATRTPPIPSDASLPTMQTFDPLRECRVFIASPCLTMAQQWLVDEALRGLARFDVSAISPYDLGLDGSPLSRERIHEILISCNAILVLADGVDLASVFAMGLARIRGLPIVVLAEEVKQLRIDLWQGPDCEITRDFATAVYRAMVAARRNLAR